jgi:hypothetical protein
MTTISVQGANFVAGSMQAVGTQILIDGVPVDPNGGIVDSLTIKGATPPHDPGVFPVVVRTGSAEVDAGTFEYIAPPRVLDIYPTSGAAGADTPLIIAGDHFRKETHILFGKGSGGAALVCPTMVSEHRITGYAPRGSGTVIVSANDLTAGSVDGGVPFTYLGSPGRDGGLDPDASAIRCDDPDGGTAP